MTDEVLVDNDNGVQGSQLHDYRCTQQRKCFELQFYVSRRRLILKSIAWRIEKAFFKWVQPWLRHGVTDVQVKLQRSLCELQSS